MGSGFQTSFTGFYQKRVRSRHIPANTAGSVHDNSVDVLQLSVTVTSMWTVSSGFYPEDASMALPFQDHRTIERHSKKPEHQLFLYSCSNTAGAGVAEPLQKIGGIEARAFTAADWVKTMSMENP
ncbi:predicted protein [Histoplasma capsulatum G186AR]|uniref:Uncharacterized protein n=1 Tax=Ajellomyces capsulatus (strain G186AR / H82 / ATCC MYA-2454 / RMSCC 2432) TaxID=447093 RepID=C0NFF2_AJECG|nr:uncharacterized protein HCBG_01618 [Histoplasma capsulatum G186AR]EEH09973.1 predicted protein [Histoplasma capsulatum G186AR]